MNASHFPNAEGTNAELIDLRAEIAAYRARIHSLSLYRERVLYNQKFFQKPVRKPECPTKERLRRNLNKFSIWFVLWYLATRLVRSGRGFLRERVLGLPPRLGSDAPPPPVPAPDVEAQTEHEGAALDDSEPPESVGADRPAGDERTTQLRPPPGGRRLRVACILDEFSFHCFAPEADFLQLSPEDYENELERFKPDFLFVESVWRGKDGKWKGKFPYPRPFKDPVLFSTLDHCRKLGLPMVFWNKEDPVSFEEFLPVARMFDFVFTTDVACAPMYRKELGHDRVGVLPFAAQPVLHNPVRATEKTGNVCFAGSCFPKKYPVRAAIMREVLLASSEWGLDIFDRNQAPDCVREGREFPEDLLPFIRGAIPYLELSARYRDFKLVLNFNSVTESRTMFARRVFEALGSGTAVVSTKSPGIREMFGPLVPFAETGESAKREVGRLFADTLLRRRTEALGVRIVMRDHTYALRFREVAKAAGFDVGRKESRMACLLAGKDSPRRFSECLFGQEEKPDVVFVPESMPETAKALGDAGISVSPPPDRLSDALGNEGDSVAVIHSDGVYGPHYLLDARMALAYSRAAVSGMASAWKSEDGRLSEIGHPESECLKGVPVFAGSVVSRPGWLDRNRRVADMPPAALLETDAADGYARYGFEFAVGRESVPPDRLSLDLTSLENNQ